MTVNYKDAKGRYLSALLHCPCGTPLPVVLARRTTPQRLQPVEQWAFLVCRDLPSRKTNECDSPGCKIPPLFYFTELWCLAQFGTRLKVRLLSKARDGGLPKPLNPDTWPSIPRPASRSTSPTAGALASTSKLSTCPLRF